MGEQLCQIFTAKALIFRKYKVLKKLKRINNPVKVGK
jgi:hypothetical protein